MSKTERSHPLLASRIVRACACACIVAALSGSNFAAPTAAIAPGDTAPALAALGLGSPNTTHVRWAEAALTVVNFWATWCAPCRTEMPTLEALRKENAAPRLAVVGVLLDLAEDEVALKFATDLEITYPLLRGTTALSDRWGGIGLMPTTFLVDSKGIVRRRYVGATPEIIDRLKADIATLLESAPSTPVPAPGVPAPPKKPKP